MNNVEFIRNIVEVSEVQDHHNDFYELAEKYGFLAPWSVLEEEYNYSFVG